MIEAKVAKVLSNREVVLNRGSSHGVTEGDKFDILGDHEIKIEDPDSNEMIGTIQGAKVRVIVRIVKERFCIAHTFESYKVNVGGVLDVHQDSFASVIESLTGRWERYRPSKWVTKVETLKAPTKQGDRSEIPVEVGDRAVQVVG